MSHLYEFPWYSDMYSRNEFLKEKWMIAYKNWYQTFKVENECKTDDMQTSTEDSVSI